MRFFVLILIPAALLAGCGDKKTDTSPSSTSSTPTIVTERFDAILDLKESKYYPFSVNQSSGSVMINLASLSPLNRPGLIDAAVEIGYGKTVKDDDGNVVACDLRRTMQATPALTAQLTDTLTPAQDWCANIADVGNLREPVNFSMRISHP